MLPEYLRSPHSAGASAESNRVIWLIVIFCALMVFWGAVERLAPAKRVSSRRRMRGRNDRPFDWARN
jgi:hypothetical protein